jgi:hypothetical protein
VVADPFSRYIACLFRFSYVEEKKDDSYGIAGALKSVGAQKKRKEGFPSESRPMSNDMIEVITLRSIPH